MILAQQQALQAATTQQGIGQTTDPDVKNLLQQLLGAASAEKIGINVTDPDFKYPQNFTGTFGIDHWLPWDIIGTFEFLYRKEINALYVRDLNLAGPRLVGGNAYRDVNGRVLYADTMFTAAGNGAITATRLNQTRIDTTGPATGRVAFSEGAIEERHTNLERVRHRHRVDIAQQDERQVAALLEPRQPVGGL